MGSIGVVAEDNSVRLIQVRDLHLRPDEPFWQYDVQSASRLVDCGASEISYVPARELLVELQRLTRGQAGPGRWEVNIPDHLTPQTHRHPSSKPLAFTASSQVGHRSSQLGQLFFRDLSDLVARWVGADDDDEWDLGEFVCIYDNQEPYKGWVAADVTYKTFRPLWAKIEELRVAQRLWTQPLNTTQSSQLLLRQLISIYPLASR